MGFWKTLGKIGLKVAPYAAMAIPGVGIPLGMALGGGLSALDTKVSGGSWKDALVSGGIGAGTSAVGLGALKGIGPSSGVTAKLLKGASGAAGNAGKVGILGKALGDMGANAAMSAINTPKNPTPVEASTAVNQAGIGPSFTPSSPSSSSLSNSILAGRNKARQRLAYA